MGETNRTQVLVLTDQNQTEGLEVGLSRIKLILHTKYALQDDQYPLIKKELKYKNVSQTIKIIQQVYAHYLLHN